jgi:CDP-glucose 4,6-dehydratase
MSKFQKTFKGKTVLVTGHTGFKGSWLVTWLNSLGAIVVGVANGVPSTPAHFNVAVMSNFVNSKMVDIRDSALLDQVILESQPDFVFHLAAQALVRFSYDDPRQTWQTNTFGTINLLESLRKLNKPCVVVLITSDKSYDNLEWVWGYKETDKIGGIDPYSASKGGAELAIRSYVASYFPKDGGVKIGVGRAGNVIGGGDWAADRIVPDCMKSCAESAPLEIRMPYSTRPWQHVLEPLSGYLALATSLNDRADLHGQAFNFGPSNPISQTVEELVNEMAKSWGKIKWVNVATKTKAPYESSLLKLNCDKAAFYLKWRSIWDFDRTVRETVNWYRNFYETKNSPALDFTLNQIAEYTQTALEEKLDWAL